MRFSPVILVLAVAVSAIAITACSGGEGPDAGEPTVRATLPTVAATDTAAADVVEPIVEEEPEASAPEGTPDAGEEEVLRCCPSPRAWGGELKRYDSDSRLPISATFYFREKIQSYKLVRIDDQSIDESQCKKNHPRPHQPLRTGSGHYALAMVDIEWEKTYQLIPYESDDCGGPAVESYPYPLTFTGRWLLEDYPARNRIYPNDPSLPPDRLRVVGIGCLEVRSAPIFEAEVLECVPEGELLWTSDEDEEWDVDGLPWRQVRRSEDGRTEYAPLLYLQGAETFPHGELKRRGGGDFVVVYGAITCLNLREGPGYHADVVDCVPNGTGLPADDRNRVSADFAVWRPLEWEGQWVWADERLLLELGDYDYWSTTATAGELAVPPLEFPDDVALLGIATIYEEEASYWPIVRSQEMFRIRKGLDGELIRETLFSSQPTDPLDPSGYINDVIATQDLSRIVVAAGHTLYESYDGGVTWSYLDDLEKVWPRLELSFLPGENDGDPDGVLSMAYPGKYSEDDIILTLHPGGEREVVPPDEPLSMSQLWQLSEMAKDEQENPLPDLTLWEDNFAAHSWFSDEELLGLARFRQWALAREGMDIVGESCCANREIDWPAIYDPDTQLIRALAIPGVLKPEEELWPLVGLQRGPFLPVTNVDGCLPIRAEPSPDAEELACAAERVLLTHLGEAVEVDGVTWRKVRTPASIEGWADSSYLEGPEATVEFPDDVALIARLQVAKPGYQGPLTLVRTYRDGNGYVVRETLLVDGPKGPVGCGYFEEGYQPVDYSDIDVISGQLPECHGLFGGITARDDASSIVIAVCVESVCDPYIREWNPTEPLGRTILFESQDGGVTYNKLVAFDAPWIPLDHLSVNGGETQLLLVSYIPFLEDAELPYLGMWSPSGGLQDLPGPPPALDEIGCEGWCLELPDGRTMFMKRYDLDQLVGPDGPAQGGTPYYHISFWPTIRDQETGEEWPIRMPYDALRTGEGLIPVAIQQGPFLPVSTDIEEDCLPLRVEPSLGSEELDCVAERVLLQAQGDTATDEGITWRRARTPAGIVGWADARYLEE